MTNGASEPMRHHGGKPNTKDTSTFRFDMLAETSTLLKKFYKPYNQRLAHLLGSDSFLF